MKKKSKIYNIAKKADSASICCAKRYSSLSISYHGLKKPCIHEFRYTAIMEGTNNYDNLGRYIRNNDKLAYYRFYNNDE